MKKLQLELMKTNHLVCQFLRINNDYRILALFAFLTIYASHSLIAQSVSTFAGSGVQGTANGTLLECQFLNIEQMAFDSKGNLYIVDFAQNVIRKIDTLGNVSNYAGAGITGYLDGNISVAEFNRPIGIVIDKNDNMFVSDDLNFVIRKIDTLGNVTTFAGSGVQGYTDGVSSIAQFGGGGYMCIDDSSNLYVADYSNEVIRKIDTLGNVSTFAGSGIEGNSDGPANLATFNFPISIAYNKLHDVFYVSDRNNNLIRKIDALGNVSTYAGDGVAGHADGLATTARFNAPKGLITDSIGNLYVAGRLDYTIRKIDTMGIVTTIAGVPELSGYVNGPNYLAEFGRPISVIFDKNNNLLVTDSDNYRIRGVEVYSILSVNELAPSENSFFSLYPNPTNGQFTITLSKDQAELFITNLLGQQILKTQLTQMTTSFQLDKDEVYLVYVKTKEGTSVQKLIVNL